MKKHGVASGEGCAADLYDDETGDIVDVEICYCSSDGCNKNCTCSKSDRPDSSEKKVWFKPGQTNGNEVTPTTPEVNTNENGMKGLDKGNVEASDLATMVLKTTTSSSEQPVSTFKKGKKGKGGKGKKKGKGKKGGKGKGGGAGAGAGAG